MKEEEEVEHQQQEGRKKTNDCRQKLRRPDASQEGKNQQHSSKLQPHPTVGAAVHFPGDAVSSLANKQ